MYFLGDLKIFKLLNISMVTNTCFLYKKKSHFHKTFAIRSQNKLVYKLKQLNRCLHEYDSSLFIPMQVLFALLMNMDVVVIFIVYTLAFVIRCCDCFM